MTELPTLEDEMLTVLSSRTTRSVCMRIYPLSIQSNRGSSRDGVS